MKNLAIVLALAFLILPGCNIKDSTDVELEDIDEGSTTTVESTDEEDEETEEDDDTVTTTSTKKNPEALTAEELAMKETACEDSGGTFANKTCDCPDDVYGENTALYTYDEFTGQCLDPHGVPGGKLGDNAVEDQDTNE